MTFRGLKKKKQLKTKKTKQKTLHLIHKEYDMTEQKTEYREELRTLFSTVVLHRATMNTARARSLAEKH